MALDRQGCGAPGKSHVDRRRMAPPPPRYGAQPSVRRVNYPCQAGLVGTGPTRRAATGFPGGSAQTFAAHARHLGKCQICWLPESWEERHYEDYCHYLPGSRSPPTGHESLRHAQLNSHGRLPPFSPRWVSGMVKHFGAGSWVKEKDIGTQEQPSQPETVQASSPHPGGWRHEKPRGSASTVDWMKFSECGSGEKMACRRDQLANVLTWCPVAAADNRPPVL